MGDEKREGKRQRQKGGQYGGKDQAAFSTVGASDCEHSIKATLLGNQLDCVGRVLVLKGSRVRPGTYTRSIAPPLWSLRSGTCTSNSLAHT